MGVRGDGFAACRPVDAPLRLIFRQRWPDRYRKFTKPLLYRLSYVGENAAAQV